MHPGADSHDKQNERGNPNKSWESLRVSLPFGGRYLREVTPHRVLDPDFSYTSQCIFNASVTWTHLGGNKLWKIMLSSWCPTFGELKRLWVKGGDISERQAGKEEERRRRGGGRRHSTRLILFIPCFGKGGEESASLTSVSENTRKKIASVVFNAAKRALFSGGEFCALTHLDTAAT